MQSLVAWSIRHRSVVLLLTALIFAVGIFSATQFPEELLPNVSFPDVIIVTSAPGLSAQQIDTDVSTPIASAVRSTDNISSVTSDSTDGESIVILDFSLSSDPTADEAAVQSEVQGVALPSQASPPQVTTADLSAVPIEYVAITPGPGQTIQTLGAYVNSTLLPQIEQVNGVSAVSAIGVPKTDVDVAINPVAMSEHGVSTTALVNALQTNTLSGELGSIASGEYQIGVDVTPAPDLLSSLNLLAIPDVRGGVVPLGMIATVTEVPDPDSGLAYFDGKPAVSLSITKTDSANLISTVNGVGSVLAGAKSIVGTGGVSIVYQSASDVKASVNGLFDEAMFGALLAVIVIFLFLLSIRATLVTVVSLPTSIFFALSLAHVAGLTLNIMTMAGLTVAVGRVVDDAIVVLENIYRHYQSGMEISEAAVAGTNEVMRAIALSTVSTILVFAPIAIVGGIISSFFLSFSIIVGLALIASFFVAITLIPVLSTLFLRSRHHAPKRRSIGEFATRPLLSRVLSRTPFQLGVVALAIILFLSTVPLAGTLPQQLIPPSKEKGMELSITLPTATGFQETLDAVRPFEDTVGKHVNGFSSADVAIGGISQEEGVTLAGPPNVANFIIGLTENSNVNRAESQVKSYAKHLFPSASIGIQSFSFDTGAGEFQATLTAPTEAGVEAEASKLKAYILTLKNTSQTSVSTSLSEPRIELELDPSALANGDISAAAIQTTLPLLLGHSPVATIGTGTGTPVYLSVASGENAVASLASIPIGNNLEPLSTYATPVEANLPAELDKYNGEPSATIETTFSGTEAGNDTLKLENHFESLSLPSGVAITFAGSSQDELGSIFSNMGLAAGVAITLIFLLLVVFFGSLGVPLVILVALPLASIGALIAMAVTGTALGLPSLMGLLMLIGIVVSNSILLVDFIRQGQRRGEPAADAVIGAATNRTRPILMTAVVTIAALTPLAIGVSGGGALISQGLGIAVIGGLVTSTLLTLVVVPTTFTLGVSLKRFASRRTKSA